MAPLGRRTRVDVDCLQKQHGTDGWFSRVTGDGIEGLMRRAPFFGRLAIFAPRAVGFVFVI